MFANRIIPARVRIPFKTSLEKPGRNAPASSNKSSYKDSHYGWEVKGWFRFSCGGQIPGGGWVDGQFFVKFECYPDPSILNHSFHETVFADFRYPARDIFFSRL